MSPAAVAGGRPTTKRKRETAMAQRQKGEVVEEKKEKKEKEE